MAQTSLSLEENPALHATWLILLHAAAALEHDNKQRRAYRILTFWIYVLSKAMNCNVLGC